MAGSEPYSFSRSCDFDEDVGDTDSGPCSPQIDGSKFTGVVINLPETIELGTGSLRIPLACTYVHRLSDGRTTPGSLANQIIFVAVDMASHQVYSGNLPPVDGLRGPPPGFGEGTLEESAGDFEVLDELVQGYVNVDLMAILGIPPKPAEYTVYATVEKHKSNVLTIRVAGKQG
jgi:hypothetical protein